jgi:hypothetical protein
MKTFTTHPATELSASDLSAELAEYGGNAYTVTVYGADGWAQGGSSIEVLYNADEGRMGICEGGDSTWADVSSLERGIDMYLNDADAWEAAN